MVRRLYLSLLFVILLVFAQQTAMLHPYVHAVDFQQKSQNNKQVPKHSEVCGQCVALAAIGSAVDSQSSTFSVGRAVFELFSIVHQSVASEHFPDYHSRAPPTLA